MTNPSKPRNKLSLALLFFVAGNVFWLSASAPGVLSPDSLETWRQIQFWDFNNWHPVTFSIWVWLTSGFGSSIFLAVIIQSFLFSGSLVCAFKVIFKDKPWSFAVFCGSFLEFTPFVGQMGVTLWKDIPYTAMILLAFSIYGLNRSRYRIPLTIFFLVVGSSFRHDGVYLILVLIFLVFGVVFLSKFRGNIALNFLEYGKILMVSFFLTLAINQFAPVALNAEPTQQFTKYGPLLQDLSVAYQKNKDSFPRQEGALVSKMVSGDAAKGALDCERWDVMAMSPGVDIKLVNESGSDILRIWVRALFSKSGGDLISAHFCRSKAFLPGISVPRNWVWTYFSIDSNDLGISRNSFQATNEIASRIDQAFFLFGRYLGWPGMYLNVLILSVWCLRKIKTPNRSFLFILITLGIARGLLNSLYTTGPYYRYGLLTQLSALVVVWFITFNRISDYFLTKVKLTSKSR